MIGSLLAPRMLVVHAAVVVAMVAAALLGLWQYDVWQDHRHDRAALLANAPAEPLDRVLSADAAFPGDRAGQPVRFRGRWLPTQTVYVEGKTSNGRNGYWVVTPLAVCPAASSCAKAPAVLVVRGWSATPHAAAPGPGDRRVVGWLQPADGAAAPDLKPSDPVLPSLRTVDVLQRMDRDLYAGYVIWNLAAAPSAASDAAGLEPVTPASLPKPSAFTSVRNLLYALEWWFFGGFAVWLWVRWCRDEIARVRLVSDGLADQPDEVASSA